MKLIPAVPPWVIAGIFGLAVGIAQPASASTLTLLGSYDNEPPGPQITYDSTDDRGEITCSLGCEGALSNLASGVYDPDVPDATTFDGWSGTVADLFALENSGISTETAFVNTITGESFLVDENNKTDSPTLSFVSSAQYLLFVIGADPRVALVRNFAANNVFDYTAFSGEGAGLSHIVELGVIPIPATLPLFLTGLLGLGFLARRRRQMAEA